MLPVREQRAKDHERVLQLRDDLGRRVPAQQELPSVLEGRESEVVSGPLVGHDPQLGFDVLLFHG